MVNIKRVRSLKKRPEKNGQVLYWMSRDQRVSDNWALAYAIEIAENRDQYVQVIFTLVDEFMGATWRQFDFMLKGLKKIESRLEKLNIPFTVLIGDPVHIVPQYIAIHNISHLVTDFDPLKIKQQWKNKIAEKIEISFDETDAHNIVPCWLASDKQETGAYTFRPKISRQLPDFLDEFPPLIPQKGKFHRGQNNWEAISIALRVDHSIHPVDWLSAGERGAKAILENFLENKFHRYAGERNDPNEDCLSNLSPYLRFGHISAQRVVLELLKIHPDDKNTQSFFEEIIVRRELSDNFCFYNSNYDLVEGFPPWAQKSLDAHRKDAREHIYSLEHFENALTHDDLWNAAQLQMVVTGKMHGYLRMYWAKKILEWSLSPEEALHIALFLNDKYELDGRDANGFTGCAWSIGGVHDRAWSDRPVYGKIRAMNYKGCERKFDVKRFIASINQIAGKRKNNE